MSIRGRRAVAKTFAAIDSRVVARCARAVCARDGDVDARDRCACFVCIDSRRPRRERAGARARADGMMASTLRGRRLRPERGAGDWARERERGRRD